MRGCHARTTTRGYQHSGRLSYHSDPSDAVALMCVRPAKSGGLSSNVSSVAVHNESVRTRPDLAEVLYQPWWHDSRTGACRSSTLMSSGTAVPSTRITRNRSTAVICYISGWATSFAETATDFGPRKAAHLWSA
ncbi:TauD/TfdA family dioxygenase [Nonomuraea wenchangensis]